MGAMSIVTFQPLPRLVSSFHTGLEPIRYELQGQLLMGWFISMWTPDIYSTEARALPSAVNGSVACRPPPRPLQRWLFQQPRPERHLHVRVHALSMTRPRSLRDYLLTNSFVVYASYCPDLPIL